MDAEMNQMMEDKGPKGVDENLEYQQGQATLGSEEASNYG